jgi:glutathionylspermidine synthase
MNDKLTAAVQNLDRRILANHRFDKKLFAQLDEAQHELGILSGKRPFCPFLRPAFFSRKVYEKITRAAEILAGAMEKMTLGALENEEIMRVLDLTEREERLARINPRYKTVCNSSRFDAFTHGEDFKFLEYNGETPAGIVDQMQIEKIFNLIPEVREFLSEHEHWRPQPHVKLLNALVADYRDFGGKKEKPNIAVVDWNGVSTYSEFVVLREFFQSEGHESIIADPHELEYDGRVLRVGAFEIDIFYKRVVIQEFLEKFPEDNALSNAYRAGKVCMLNSFRTKIPNKKASFAVLSDKKYAYLFTAEERATIAKHVPWTRRVRDAKVDFDGREIDLLEKLRRERERFLLKPNDDYGGNGIVLGWETSAGEWDAALQKALDESFVAQERAAVEKVMFPAYSDEAETKELLIDFDPFLFGGKAEGGLVRLSSSSLVNVAQGGGETALIVLENAF